MPACGTTLVWGQLVADADADADADAGTGIVPDAWVDSLGDGSPEAWSAATVDPLARAGTTSYANQWWCLDGRPTARGIHGQLVTVQRASGIVITVLSSQPEALDPRLTRVHRDFANAVNDRLALAG